MKIFSFILFLFIIVTLNTCAESINDQKSSEVTITGIIENFENYRDEYIIVNTYVNNIIKTQENHPSYINKDGFFRIQFNLDNPQDVTLTYGKRAILLFIQPNDSLHMQIDADQLLEDGVNNNSVSILGTSKEINEILIDYRPKFSVFLHQTYIDDFEPKILAKDLSANGYKSYLYDRMSKNKSFLNSYIKKNNIKNEMFEKWATMEIENRCLERMLSYRRYHARYNDIDEMDVKLPDHYYDFLEKYPVNNSDNLMCSASYWYLIKYIALTMTDFFYQNNLSYSDSSNLKYLISTFNQKESMVRDITLCRIFYHQMDINFKLFEPYYETYIATVENEAFKNPVLDKYNILFENENLERLLSEANLYVFLDQDTILTEITDKHKTKVIYIDFWATWCGACITEFPNSRKLYEQFRNKKISFVYLCNRSTKQSWQNMISKQKLAGDHYLLTNRQYEVLSSIFRITEIPHYVLIDKNGNVIKNHAKRPSDPELMHDINDLL